MDEKFKKALKIAVVVVGIIIVVAVYGSVASRSLNNKAQTSKYSYKMGMTAPSSNGLEMSEPMMDRAGESLAMDADDMIIAQGSPIAGSEEVPADSDKKIVKNGNLSMKVDSADETSGKISEVAKNNQGEVFSTRIYETAGGSKNGTVTIKVPFANFEKVIGEIKKFATQVISESINSQDVTEQYVDLQAQLKNKQAEEQAFAKILEQSGEIDDVLKVTRELARVRGEIERLQGRIRYLESQTDMSTITIQLSEDVEISPVTQNWRPWQVIKASASKLIKNLQGFINGLIRFIIVGIPTLLIIVLVIWIVYWVGRKFFRKMFKKESVTKTKSYNSETQQ